MRERQFFPRAAHTFQASGPIADGQHHVATAETVADTRRIVVQALHGWRCRFRGRWSQFAVESRPVRSFLAVTPAGPKWAINTSARYGCAVCPQMADRIRLRDSGPIAGNIQRPPGRQRWIPRKGLAGPVAQLAHFPAAHPATSGFSASSPYWV